MIFGVVVDTELAEITPLTNTARTIYTFWQHNPPRAVNSKEGDFWNEPLKNNLEFNQSQIGKACF